MAAAPSSYKATGASSAATAPRAKEATAAQPAAAAEVSLLLSTRPIAPIEP
jgi:hypothetical protein